MTEKIKHIFEAFMKIRFAHVRPEESYYTEWKKRFEDGMEWQKADYANRLVLKSISPDMYPYDRDEFFIRE